jgi:hypothetical protein
LPAADLRGAHAPTLFLDFSFFTRAPVGGRLGSALQRNRQIGAAFFGHATLSHVRETSRFWSLCPAAGFCYFAPNICSSKQLCTHSSHKDNPFGCY